VVLHTISVTLLIKYCFCILDSVLYEIRYSKHTVAIQMHLGRYCSSQSSQVLSPFFHYFWCRCKSLSGCSGGSSKLQTDPDNDELTELYILTMLGSCAQKNIAHITYPLYLCNTSP
jgi:hypothetical protein